MQVKELLQGLDLVLLDDSVDPDPFCPWPQAWIFSWIVQDWQSLEAKEQPQHPVALIFKLTCTRQLFGQE